MHGKLRGENIGFLTPNAPTSDLLCRSFSIPNQTDWLGNFMGALLYLCEAENWRQYGTVTPDEAAAAYQQIFDDGYFGSGACNMVGTPYWDDDEDVGLEEPTDMQTWYGSVSNPTAPPTELDFVENALVWAFTGLLAIATPELAFAPAILFNTIAPRFIIAMKRGDIGEIFRIVVDGQDMARVDTTPYSAGEIINVPIIANPSLDTHSLIIVGMLP